METNTLLGKHHKANQYVNELHVDGSVLSEPEEIAEAFNDYFVNIGPNLANECPGQSSTNDTSFLDFCEWNSEEFSFDKISVQNVALTLKSLKASKATGLDKIPAKILKVAADSIAPSLTFIFNLSLSSGIFVNEWKYARVTPIFKSDDRKLPENFRPISILPIISKVFEKEVFRQLYTYLSDKALLSDFQSGFRPKHSTLSALIHMCDEWYRGMDQGNLTGVVFLDIRKAFDSINHTIYSIR